jgi:hypothetical protein
MKNTNSMLTWLLLIVFLATSCAVGSIPATATPPQTNAILATATVGSIPIQENAQDFGDASQWQNTFESIFGELYRYDKRDISPDGHWIVRFYDKTLRLIDVNNPTKPIEYQVSGDDILFISLASWAPDSSAFVACMLYHSNKDGCDAIKIFEVSVDGVISEHDVMWGSPGGSVDVVWSPNNFDIIFRSNLTGLWLFNRKGSLINHNFLPNLASTILVSNPPFTKIFSVRQPIDPATYEYLPSSIYELSPNLDITGVYEFADAVRFLGIDSQSKYILLGETSPDRQTSPAIILFDLSSHTIIQRYPLSVGEKINNSAEGDDKIAFDFYNSKNIWVFDFKTKTIEIHKPGMLMGWLYPDRGFLIWDENRDWKILTP